MKAKVFDRVALRIDLTVQGIRIPKGSLGVVVGCYAQPEGYDVDVEIPAPELVGDVTWKNVGLQPEQFDVVEPYSGPNPGW